VNFIYKNATRYNGFFYNEFFFQYNEEFLRFLIEHPLVILVNFS